MDWLAVVRGSGLQTKKALGQSFIVHQPTLDAIAEGWDIGRDDEVFEIGTGPGNLTAALAARARRVWTVELDGRWAAVARRTSAAPNAVWIEGDALRLIRQVSFGQPMRVVGNLPYSSYHDILLALLEWPAPVVDIGVTLQEDVVAKLTETEPLAVLVRSMYDVKRVMRVPRNRFYPQPRVDSASVRLIPRGLRSPFEARRLERGLKRLFASRRKLLRAFDPDAEPIRISEAPGDLLLRTADRLTRSNGGA